MEKFGQLLVPGKPKLPSRIFAIAIPPGVTADSVEIVGKGRVELPGSYHITPAPMVSPSDANREENDTISAEYDHTVAQAYATDELYIPAPKANLLFRGRTGNTTWYRSGLHHFNTSPEAPGFSIILQQP